MNPCDISLYAIIDPNRTKGRSLPDRALAAARGGMTLLQYRDKSSDTKTLIENARAIKSAIAGHNIPLLINDRVDVALAAKADGVHVGQNDIAPADARRLLGPDAIIGLTIKNIGHAHAAPLEFLDYVCAGGVYSTLSKDNPRNIGLDGWAEIAEVFRKRNAQMPVGAIAGIDQTNIADVIRAGADGCAIISAIFMADDVETATAQLKSRISEARI